MNKENTVGTETGLEIAVIGMAGRFPGAKHIDEFWENLKNGVESIIFFSDEELEKAGVPTETLNASNYVKARGYLKDIEYFDAAFFGYKPSEAEHIDPQVRLFYQCTWHALENAGYAPATYKGLIGVYAGASGNFTWEALAAFPGQEKDAAASFVSLQLANKDFLCTGISYKLNLQGPSFTIYTACSTSLVALHLACQALLSGECSIALAGGVSVLLPPKSGYFYHEGLIFSPDGYCRAFDKDASGTVFGSGVGIVALKPLENAIAHRDTIHAVIKGTAINNDGNRKVGFTAPSTKGQAEAIRAAYKAAEVNPETLGYIEAHGTGTALGDPIEIEALSLAFGTDKKQFCRIGSVKTNIGHLDAAAGAAGFIKTVFILKHRLIPPSLHCETPNPKIGFENTPFRVNTTLTEWKEGAYPRRAGVSSFGVGGTNAHVVLEEWSQDRGGVSPPEKSRQYQLILFSAKTQFALDNMTQNLSEHFKKNPNINMADAAYTLQVGREAFPYRSMAVGSNLEDAVTALSQPESGLVQTYQSPRGNPPVVFMFSGQGSQYVNMGLELYHQEPVFRENIDRCFEILNTLTDYKIKEILYPPATCNLHLSPDINQTEIAQPLLFAFEYALAKLLMKWGIQPYAMIGHSIGEYVAACLAGVFSLESALELVVSRGKLMQQMPTGAMLSVQLPEEQIKNLMSGHPEVEMAANNGPMLCVVSGPHEAVQDFARYIEEKGHRCQMLHTSHAFHSRSMDPILEEFKKTVSTITLKDREPLIPYISNVTGKFITPGEITDPGYWAVHLRRTVRFGDGLTQLLKEPDTVFVEVGPGRALSTFVQKHSDKKPEHQVVNLIRHPREDVPDTFYLLSKIGQLWIYGKAIDWARFYPTKDSRGSRIPLPLYPFERCRHWKLADRYSKRRQRADRSARWRKIGGISDWFYRPCWKQIGLPPFSADGTAKKEKPIWLLFMDQCGIGDQLLQRLQQQGYEVICVNTGPTFEKQDENTYIINPRQPGDYQTLFKHLAQHPQKPSQVLHLWSVTGNETKSEEKKFRYGDFYQLLWLVQAMEKENFDHALRLTVVSDNMQDVTGQERLQPLKSIILALVKVTPQEYPNIKCHSIDIQVPEPGSLPGKKPLDLLMAECAAESLDTVVALRSNLRWVLDYEPVTIEESIKEAAPLKEKSVCLITGGLGGIGLALAKQLAAAVKARLVLTGRSEFPIEDQWQKWLETHEDTDPISHKIRQLQEMKTRGAEVLVCQADAANQQHMHQVIERAEKQFGPLNLVIHAAGVLDTTTFKLIPQIDEQGCEGQFKPKIEGLQVLDKVLEGRNPDLCLVTSSLSSVLGGLGYAPYAAGNLFMDAFVHLHNRTNSQRWLSVNLDAWKTQTQPQPEGTENTEFNIILPGQGVEALMRVATWRLQAELNQVVVSVTDLQSRIDQWIKLQALEDEEENTDSPTREEPTAHQERPQLSTPYMEPQTQLEERLTSLWQDFFGLDRVGIHDNFFDLGATSLDMVQLSGKLKKVFGRDVPVVTLFRYPMIASLAKHLDGEDSVEKISKQEQEKKRAGERQKGRRTMQSRLQLLKKG